MSQTPPLRNPLGTALATARETVAIAHEANIPFDRANFFPTEIDPAAAIADAHAYQCKSNKSQNPCPPSPPKVPSRSDFFALINKITKQRPPTTPAPPPFPFDTPGTLSESILHNLKPGLRLPNSQPPPGRWRPPT